MPPKKIISLSDDAFGSTVACIQTQCVILKNMVDTLKKEGKPYIEYASSLGNLQKALREMGITQM